MRPCIPEDTIENLLKPGNLLVSAPQKKEFTFAESVVMVLEHNAKGVQGIVLNSEANDAMRSWCRQIASQSDKLAVFQQIQEVATSAAQLAKQGDGLPFTVCMEKPADSVEDIVDQLGRGVRIFIGRVYWTAQQLKNEIADGNWMITPATPELVFGDHENLWKTCVQKVGENVLGAILKVPNDPPGIIWN